MRKLIGSPIALLCLGLLTGCGSRDKFTPPHSQHDSHAIRVQGSLVDALKAQQALDYSEDCDRRFAAQKLEIAEALDRRKNEIEAFVAATPPSAVWRRESFGPTTVRHQVERPTPEPGWQTEIYSWHEVYQHFQKFKDTETSPDWVWIDADARSLIGDDESRLRGHSNEYLDKDSGPALAKSAGEVKACTLRNSCTRAGLTPATQKFLSDNPYYSTHLKRTEAADASQAPLLWKKFLDRLDYDLEDYSFKKESTLRRTGEAVLELTLDPGPFAEVKDALARIIEKTWNSTRLSLKIVWTHEKPSEEKPRSFFHFGLGDSSGERAYVNRYHRLIQLFPDSRTTSIAHEIGHVLGLPDRYFTVWKPEKCEYHTQFNEEDIMSTSSTGSVTSEDWQTLRAEYPLTR